MLISISNVKFLNFIMARAAGSKDKMQTKGKRTGNFDFPESVMWAGNFGYGGQLYKPSQIIHQQQIINPEREIKWKVLTLQAVNHQLTWALMAFSDN